jgi:hypothetical protein
MLIEVFDKDFTRKRVVGAPKFLTVHPRHLRVGDATFALPLDDRASAALMAEGACVRIWDDDETYLMAGPVTGYGGTGPSRTSMIEVRCVDWLTILTEGLGWVQPTQPISNQGIAGKDWTMTGAAESVLKEAVQANLINRLNQPLHNAPNLGRGGPITARLRFHPLYDRLWPVVDGAGLEAAGIGVTVKHVGGHTGGELELDCYVPRVYPRKLTEASGVVGEWSFTKTNPTATNVVVGGQGEAQARMFREVTDAARATAVGRKIERYRDARDTSDNLIVLARGQEVLDEGAAKTGLQIQLHQTKNFRYGAGLHVGDQVTLELANGVQITDFLTEALLSWTREEGWRAIPRVGERPESSDTIVARAIKALARTIQNANRT